MKHTTRCNHAHHDYIHQRPRFTGHILISFNLQQHLEIASAREENIK
jgi:hypothetical protein